jgi:bifunctional pyridoxal-dependent enzyme with beta-cystathionase and maltose regulon repressor activities
MLLEHLLAGDRIIIQPPVYHPFYSTVENNGRVLAFNPLLENEGVYTINYDGLAKLARRVPQCLFYRVRITQLVEFGLVTS